MRVVKHSQDQFYSLMRSYDPKCPIIIIIMTFYLTHKSTQTIIYTMSVYFN